MCLTMGSCPRTCKTYNLSEVRKFLKFETDQVPGASDKEFCSVRYITNKAELGNTSEPQKYRGRVLSVYRGTESPPGWGTAPQGTSCSCFPFSEPSTLPSSSWGARSHIGEDYVAQQVTPQVTQGVEKKHGKWEKKCLPLRMVLL